MDYLIRNAESLKITIGDCYIQTHENYSDVVLIPLIYNGITYEFHQKYEKIISLLTDRNINIINDGAIFKRNIDDNYNDDEVFKNSITFIKDYVWSHYKKTLRDYSIKKPCQYIALVNLCSSKKGGKVEIQYNCNGCNLFNGTRVRLMFKGEKVIVKPLKDIRKNMQIYISQRKQFTEIYENRR